MPAPQTLIVQSPQNARVKALRAAIAQPPRTGEDSLIGIEGMHLLEEALRSGLAIDTIFVCDGSEALVRHLELGRAQVVSIDPKVLNSSVSTETPQPVAALVRAPIFRMADVFRAATPLVMVLDALQDPGNLGTLLRSAEAFGASGVIALPGTVSVWNPKCQRASAGSVFRLPVITSQPEGCVKALAAHRVRSLASVVTDAKAAAQIDLRAACALWIGNEGSGLPDALLRACEGTVTIPYPGPVESLNAAVAASVLLYEAARQRGLGR